MKSCVSRRKPPIAQAILQVKARQGSFPIKVRMYGCNLSYFCITEFIACSKGASMYAMTSVQDDPATCSFPMLQLKICTITLAMLSFVSFVILMDHLC